MYSYNKNKDRKHFCRFCLHAFSRSDLLEKHRPECIVINGTQKIELPDDNDKWMNFRNFHKGLIAPFIIYADFEAITKPIQSVEKIQADLIQMVINCMSPVDSPTKLSVLMKYIQSHVLSTEEKTVLNSSSNV